jgi:hypothetical protein
VLPHVQISNRTWSFATHLIGESSGPGRVYVSNTGPADLHIPLLYIGDTGQSNDQPSSFQITHSSCSPVPDGPPAPPEITPGQSCFIEFQFTPQFPGWQTAAIYMADDAANSPQIIRIGGTGIGSLLELANTSWTFGAHRVGETSRNGVIYPYNGGPTTITFRSTQIVESGGLPDFNLLSNTCGSLLKPYTSCTITFNFTPHSPGEHTASLNLNDNSMHGPIQVPLYGYGY